MLSFQHRFHGHGSLRYVYKNGTAIRSHLFTVKYVSNPHRRHSRFSIVVSKKVYKGAVGRNRIRRRLYEIIRAELPKIERVHDVAVIVSSSEVMSLPFSELEESLAAAFDQAGLYKKR
ncbi:MAG TPA: ribonuclease P protein component [Candidatus Saccharimonadales bacterium]|nr:ribonuclease P protein component [Candidatus Saccharimonadales bacterium]